MSGMFFQVFCLFQHVSLDLIYPGSAEAYIGRGKKLHSHLMACYVRNVCTKNCQNMIIGFKVTVKNVGDIFLRHSVYLKQNK